MAKQFGGSNNLFGLLSILSGIVGAGCCCFNSFAPGLFGAAALVLGFLHHQRVRQGKASAPMLGYLGMALGVVALALACCGSFSGAGKDLREDYSPFVD